MSPASQANLHEEIDLIQRFAVSYRRKLADVIDRMNRGQGDVQCMKLCVEAVDMMLESQNHLAQALLESRESPTKVAA
jgi:hypothetical protein